MDEPTYNSGFKLIFKKIVWGITDFHITDFKSLLDFSQNNDEIIKKLGAVHFICLSFVNHTDNNKRNYKYKNIVDIINNKFLSDNVKNDYIRYHNKTQNTYLAFNKLAYIYKYKKAVFGCNEDMYMNPIKETNKNVFTVFHENRKYLFTYSDMIKIINNSLSNTDDLYSEPLPCKNPYNNLSFNKSNLYHIYFSLKKSDYNIPELFQYYFNCEFLISKYVSHYEYILRNKAILKKSKSNEYIDDKYQDIMCMVEEYNFLAKNDMKIHIDDQFPSKLLVEKLDPYLYYFYLGKYTLADFKRKKNILYVHAMLDRLKKHNSHFGRVVKKKYLV